MKQLIIAEKPSVARDIARVLKCSQKGNGYLYNDKYIISWAIGHLVTLCEPEDYKPEWKKWNTKSLPIIPEEIKLKANPKTKEQLNIIKKLVKDKEVTSLICATDSGREGELIFRYIYNILGCKKPFKRLWISSMTDSAITEGFQKLKDGIEYDNLYKSAKCRSEADWLVGINASRAFTLKYNSLLSIGRVQTPTLAILVNRENEINAFIPKDYWEVEAAFKDYKGIWTDIKENDTKIFEEEKAKQIVQKVKGKEGIIKAIEKEEKKISAPLLYDLTELQRDCNKKFSFSASKTLSVVQELYEKRKMVTYPRTDSRYLSDDMIPKISIILGKLKAVSQYKDFTEYITCLKTLPISKRIVDNSKISDHHAIIPTEISINLKSLSSDEFKVYDLIARRFIAVFYPQYIYNTTRVITEIENECFVTKGNTIIQYGWTTLNISDDKNKEEVVLPNVNKGDIVKNIDAYTLKKKTVPPKHYNEASLLSAMENAGRFVEDDDLKEQLKESGLGTPATRASMIERLINVGYIIRKGKNLIPTDKGMKLIQVIPQELKSPETTGKWEKGLTSISKGNMQTEKFMGSITRYVNYLIQQSLNSKSDVIFPEEERNYKTKREVSVFGKCPVCGGNILENSKSFYCSNWNKNCKFSVWKNTISKYGKDIDTQIIKKLLKERKVKDVELILPQTGEKCKAELVLKEDNSGFIEIKNLIISC